jgi:hypothetical protein
MLRSLVTMFSLLSLAVACSSSDGSGGGGTGGASGGASGGAAGVSGSGGASGATGDTWTNYAQDFVQTYCVECHGAGNSSRDYTTIDDVLRDKTEIRCGVASAKLADCTASFPPPKQFPIDNAQKTNPKPSDAERDRFVQWLEAGAPQ